MEAFEPDAKLLELAKEVPNLGGLYVAPDGSITVLLVDGGEDTSGAVARRLREQIRAVYGAEMIEASREIRIRRADFRLTDLARWRGQLDRALSLPGVLSTDLDERRNRVAVGVESEEGRRRVAELIREFDIPVNAVVIEVVAPDHNMQSLRSKLRPVRGGSQIEVDTGVFAYSTCTLGFNAIHDGQKGYVTNSHCTKDQGKNNGTTHHQPDDPLFGEGNRIGKEILDPPYQAAAFGPCPEGRRCRASDSAFVRYDSDSSFGGAIIARTVAHGSRDIDASHPTDFIASRNLFPLQGMVLDKVGRTTGWTSGVVTETCRHVNVFGTDLTALCSYRVSRPAGTEAKIVDKGDSGSPVIRRSQGATGVELFGILWGGPLDGSSFVFSSILFVELDLAPLQVVDFPTSGSSGRPPIGCEPNEKCCERDADGNCTLCIPRTAACP